MPCVSPLIHVILQVGGLDWAALQQELPLIGAGQLKCLTFERLCPVRTGEQTRTVEMAFSLCGLAGSPLKAYTPVVFASHPSAFSHPKSDFSRVQEVSQNHKANALRETRAIC